MARQPCQRENALRKPKPIGVGLYCVGLLASQSLNSRLMGKAQRGSETPATTWLRQHGVDFSEHCYEYVEHGRTAESACALAVPEHSVVKTLVMADQDDRPLLVLMHGDSKVSTKNLARQSGRKAIAPCSPDDAQRNTGYL